MKSIWKVVIFLLILSLALFSCMAPTARILGYTGVPDHNDGSDVGTNKELKPPTNFVIKNNKTARDTFLKLEWDEMPGADSYRVYRAVYPTGKHTGTLNSRAFKLLRVIPASSAFGGRVSTTHPIPNLPLRRYAYKVTAVNEDGETQSPAPITGYRLPVDELEALRDIDYTIHFAQSSIPSFGDAFKTATVYGRGSGDYFYRSNTSPVSRLSNYQDFEVKLHGNPKMSLNIFTQRVTMNGDIQASGLYNAKLTYHSLLGAPGGLTKNGEVSIEYNHPTRGKLKSRYTFAQIQSYMKTVAMNNGDKVGKPPKHEWDEADTGYTRMMQNRSGN